LSAKQAKRLAPPRWWAVAISIIAAAVAFGGALRGPFQFDDIAAIVRNSTIDRLWPLDVPLHPPPRTAVSGRPVVNYSLAVSNAINNALGVSSSAIGLPSSQAAGFRVLNILIHLLCGLLLFGIIRRTMRGLRISNDWSAIADPIAGVVAMLWLVHPLNTETVDYVIQRTELLVSLFYLTTIYAAVRAWDAAKPRAKTSWYVVAVVASLLGMWSKEVMVSVPLAVMLYDRAFRADSWRTAFATRRWFYVALFATLIPLALTVAGGARADSVGFSHGITWYQYLYSQGWAITRYVRLALLPIGLTYDYGESAIRGIGGAIGLIALAAVGTATIVLWIRGRRELLWLAFLSSSFFLLLAPSSSFVPIRTEIAAERRMYLALVPIVVLVVVGLEMVRRRFASSAEEKPKWLVPAVVAVIGIALTVTSARRSLLYADAERLWTDAVAKTPANPRAYDNLAAAIIRKDSTRADEAVRALRQAIAVDSTYVTAYNNIAAIEIQRGDTAAARGLLEHALRINPGYIDATERLGALQVKAGDTPTAIASLERVVATRPTEESLSNLAIAYMSAGRQEDAKTVLRRLITMNPHRADALSYLAAMLSEEGHPDEAVGYIEAAVREGATSPQSYALLSLTYAQLGRPDESARAASVAGAQPSVDAGIYMQLGRAMMMSQRPQDADRFFTRATELAPNNPEAITRLGIAKAATGDGKGAVALFRRALSIAPGYEPAVRALAAAPASLK
jgi:tetratricopeptide (TPR) repeat protein